jgi:hypothetical protein
VSEKQFTDGGVRGARAVASVMRVRREAYFHRDNDRKLGGGIQGLECCELLGDWRRRRCFGSGGISGGGSTITAYQFVGNSELGAQILF